VISLPRRRRGRHATGPDDVSVWRCFDLDYVGGCSQLAERVNAFFPA
jgi:hypothetical protein